MSSSSGLSSLTAKSPEKPSTFSQTCSRLSQYIREKGRIGDLNLGTSCTNETNDFTGSSEMYQKRSITMNLFPMEDKLDNTFNLKNIIGKAGPRKNVTSLSLFPQETALRSSVAEEDLSKMVHTRSSTVVNKSASEVKKRAQMTIFYGGQVFVFDDFPAEKAENMMSLNSKSCSRNHNTFAPSVAQNLQSIISKMVPTAVNSSTPFSSNTNITPSTKNNLIQDLNRKQWNRTVIYGPPIARKASLHRFMEKRKDRLASRAPYQISKLISSPSKSEAAEGMPWAHGSSWLLQHQHHIDFDQQLQ